MTEQKSAVERLAERQLEQLDEMEAYRKEASEHPGEFKNHITGEWKPYGSGSSGIFSSQYDTLFPFWWWLLVGILIGLWLVGRQDG